MTRCPTAFWAALTLLLMVAAPAYCTGIRKILANQQKVSGSAIIIAQRQEGQAPNRLLAVRTAAGKRVQVHLNDERPLAALQTGMHVELTGRWQEQDQPPAQGAGVQTAAAGSTTAGAEPPAKTRFCASSLRASVVTAPQVTRGAAAASGVATASVTTAGTVAITTSSNQLVTSNLNTLIIPIGGFAPSGAACPGTQPPKFSADEVRRAVFVENSPNRTTVGSIFNRCSYGKTKLTANNSRVVEPVKLPCEGVTQGVYWRFSTCDFADFNGYADAADELLAQQGVDLSKYFYKVYLIPSGPCTFVGVGYIGCDGTFGCRSWVGGDYWASPASLAHELGHNLHLEHAGAANGSLWDQYGDDSCFMGSCCAERCPNTPHAWQLGWLTVRQLDGASLRAGQTVTAALPTQAASDRTGLRILASWATGVEPVFLGFRTRSRGDAGLDRAVAGRVLIHTSAINNTYDAQFTTLLAAMPVGQAWEYPAAGLVVRFRAVAAAAGSRSSTATVSVCRRGGAETAATCAAGTDNDCNGLAGAKDPACPALLRAAAKKRG